ncbi:MAG: cation diffusion facilitator family transporter [Phycisphaerae bacterium]
MADGNQAPSCPGLGGHGHTHQQPDAQEKDIHQNRLLWGFWLNQLLTVGQVVAGLFSGSIALLSDAVHNFSDANSLLIAWIARRISHRGADRSYTFGYRRAELIGAMINLTLLGAIGLYLVYAGIRRFFEPEPIVGWLMAAAAGLALAVDVGTALLLAALRRGTLNARTAFLHNLIDALGSLAVLLGAGTVIWLGWWWMDPVLTLLISGYLLWQVTRMLPQAARILMEATPPGIDLDDLVKTIQKVEPVLDVHHLHAWMLDEQNNAMDAHVVIPPEAAGRLENVKAQIKSMLAEQYDIHHATLEFDLGQPDEGPPDQRRLL